MIPIAVTWVVAMLLALYVFLFQKIFQQSFQFQAYAIAFVIAPISEEWIYRWLPLYFAKRLQTRTGIDYAFGFGFIANLLFVGLHVENYPYLGHYWAFCIQGVLGFACFYIARKYGYWYAVLLHIKYNLAIAFVLPLI